MVVANTIHASSPASTGHNQVPGRNRQGQSSRAGKGGCHVAAISRSCSVGPGTTRSTAQNARIKRQTAAKSQMSSVTCNHTPEIPGCTGSHAAGYHRIRMENRCHIKPPAIPLCRATFPIPIKWMIRGAVPEANCAGVSITFIGTNANRCGNAPAPISVGSCCAGATSAIRRSLQKPVLPAVRPPAKYRSRPREMHDRHFRPISRSSTVSSMSISGRRLFLTGQLVLLNKVPDTDRMEEIVIGGGIAGSIRYIPKERRWEPIPRPEAYVLFKPTKTSLWSTTALRRSSATRG